MNNHETIEGLLAESVEAIPIPGEVVGFVMGHVVGAWSALSNLERVLVEFGLAVRSDDGLQPTSDLFDDEFLARVDATGKMLSDAYYDVLLPHLAGIDDHARDTGQEG